MSPTAAPQRPRADTPPKDRAEQTASLLGSYQQHGRQRQLIAVDVSDGARLVIDLLAGSRREPRLVGRLDPDEPAENARILAELYLADPRRGVCCRRLTRADLRAPAAEPPSAADPVEVNEPLLDGDGRAYRIREIPGRGGFPELRWTCAPDPTREDDVETLSVRDVVGRLESYEPARTVTLVLLARCACSREPSTHRLRVELERLNTSHTVLNRGLREAVLAHVRAGRGSMSEIAIRCGRVKHNRAGGPVSGETSWLARRIGIAPDTPGGQPTPWVHTDVLALIARRGLNAAPCEVEVQ